MYNNEPLDVESKINPDQPHIFISPGFKPVIYISQVALKYFVKSNINSRLDCH
jgi:hypothetical protein